MCSASKLMAGIGEHRVMALNSLRWDQCEILIARPWRLPLTETRFQISPNDFSWGWMALRVELIPNGCGERAADAFASPDSPPPVCLGLLKEAGQGWNDERWGDCYRGCCYFSCLRPAGRPAGHAAGGTRPLGPGSSAARLSWFGCPPVQRLSTQLR